VNAEAFDPNLRDHQFLLRDALWGLHVDTTQPAGKALARELLEPLRGASVPDLQANVSQLISDLGKQSLLETYVAQGPNLAIPPWLAASAQPKTAPAKKPARQLQLDEDDSAPHWFVFLYGEAGIGKTTWGSEAPSPLILNLENGLKHIKCKKTKHITTFEGFQDQYEAALCSEYETIVVDTISKLEKLVWAKVLRDHSLASLTEDWHAGYSLAAEVFYRLIDRMQADTIKHGKNILLIGHVQVQNTPNPQGEAFDRYAPDLHKKVINHVTAQVDAVLYAYIESFVKKNESQEYIAKTKGDRAKVASGSTASVVCKNRFNIPNGIELNKSIYDLLKFT
jgi:phage nucleotide-binding protein